MRQTDARPTTTEGPTSLSTERSSRIATLSGPLVAAHHADVGRAREVARQGRIKRLLLWLSIPFAFLWFKILIGEPVNLLQVPTLGDDWLLWLLPVVIIFAIGAAIAMPLLSGRSPAQRVSPEQIDVGFDDVVGLDEVRDEVTRTLNTFMGHKIFREELGGKPRRGVLFEGPPGTGKTHLAKAMAHEAGVPFLFVSATSFQSMWYGATARRIRSYFADLRKVARQEGGAIGFIEEIDAIAASRGGMGASAMAAQEMSAHMGGGAGAGTQVSRFGSSEGTAGVVNELLIQMQSFDTPPTEVRMRNWFAQRMNAFLPPHRQIKAKASPYHNILIVAATNRAADLDPALVRPGRFDKKLSFDRPAKPARRALLDYFLSRKAHDEALNDDDLRDQLAFQTIGYTPVMIENLLDEALIVALKSGREAMSFNDVAQARLDIEVGLATPTPYTEAERQRTAAHEAGHAVMAHLTGHRRLEMLSIVKRKGSLGLLAHGDTEEVFTRTREELIDMIDIAMGGRAAEELYFEGVSTGPGSDLAAATRMACEIIGLHGLGSSLVSLAAVQQSSLSGTNLVGQVLRDSQTRPEVEQLLRDSLNRTKATLAANGHMLEALRDTLLEREELIGPEIVDALTAAGPPRPVEVAVQAVPAEVTLDAVELS